MRGVAAMQHQSVAVGVVEERHMADAGVEDLALELDASALELPPGLLDARDAQRDVRRVRARELLADVRRVDEVEADVLAELELGPCAGRDLLEAERVPVPRRRLLEISHRHRDEIGALDDQPTDPSICNWIRRFISTAYSSGSSFVIGSTKPETTIAEASASDSPRDIR